MYRDRCSGSHGHYSDANDERKGQNEREVRIRVGDDTQVRKQKEKGRDKREIWE